MKVWIWRDCEPLPTDPGPPRLMRAGMLAQHLAAGGHHVRWFNSTFDHYQKRQRPEGAGSIAIGGGPTLELVPGPGYASNASPRRFLHNWYVGRRCRERGEMIAQKAGEIPDVMVMDLPMPEMALAGVRLARRWGIPSVVSIRDLWPDFFMSFLSPGAARLAAPLISNIDRTVRSACAEATSIVGISPHYLEWGLSKAGRDRGPNDVILPLGYAPQCNAEDQESERRLTSKGVDFGRSLATFVGSWGKTYDIQLLIEAAAALQDRSDIQFVVAGGGDQAAMVAERARNLPNLVCPGWLDRQEIATLLGRSMVGLSPYSKGAPQGLPNKLFEYMSVGLYQVTTLGGEASDLFTSEKLGTVVPATARALAGALVEGMEVMKVPAERERIRSYFDTHFHADKIYADYTRHLERLVEQNRSERISAVVPE